MSDVAERMTRRTRLCGAALLAVLIPAVLVVGCAPPPPPPPPPQPMPMPAPPPPPPVPVVRG
jgi:hypothetical protein